MSRIKAIAICIAVLALIGARHNFPDLWATLLDWQHKTWRKFRADYSVDELDARFAREDEMERMQIKLDFGGETNEGDM